ncbi:MAG: DUF4838 domain-containing protein [Pirellulaceae bacterium]|jgi:hypothetical protein|nr:DUF4838 domain-containing protein [Pirellulaceae bacterium]
MMYRCLHRAVFVLLMARVSLGSEPLFQDGRTDWKICLSPQAGPTEAFAAEELRDALKKISGADFEILVSATLPDRRAIVLGDLENPHVGSRAAALNLRPGDVEEVAVYTLDGNLYLAGNQPRAALYAVYCFLQNELQVRWLWPGSDGEFIPNKKSWALPELKFNHRPGFAYRGFHLCGDWRDVDLFREWMGRNFINIHRHAAPPEQQRRGFYSMWSSHNVVLPKALFDRRPEYFAEIGGKRYNSNICLSNPEVDRIVAAETAAYLRKRPFLEILSVFPSDNQDYCRCPQCAKVDVSTAWFAFYNRLTDTLKREFPDLKFATIAYQGYRDVPKCPIRNSEFIEYASYSRCNIHPYGHPDCRRNEDTMRAMLAWQATGLPIGNYAYEYDIYSRNCRFVPFLSVIDDAVKTSRKLGHVSLIPEVSLSPKSGPDVYAHAVQNRLSIYLYARLLWDPDLPLRDVLDPWCQTVFGEAAEPMLNYYTAIDRAWTAMPIHATILGNALATAPHLLTDELQQEAAAAFTAAERRLPEIADPAVRARAAAALRRERVLFSQWQDLRRLGADTARLNLPLLADASDFASSASGVQKFAPAGGAEAFSTRVSAAWTRDALLVKWTCGDAEIDNLQAAAARHDDKVVEDDAVELLLSSGATGETWHFAVNSKGIRQDWRESAVGTREDLWNPPWRAETRLNADRWEVETAIPFASLGQAPNPNETWQARFVRHSGRRRDFATAEFPQRQPAVLLFNSAPRTDRTLVWWSGAPDRESPRHAAIVQEFTELGWQIHLASSTEQLGAIDGQCDAYWFRHPHGPNKVPADYWRTHLVPAVRNGAVAVFVSYWGIPLDEYFQDPALKVKSVQCGKLPLAARTTALIAPGDWSGKPHNLLAGLKTQITPAYGFVPDDASGWTVLATAPGGDGMTFPYLLARRYGKGMIVLGGDDIRLSPAKMLENFVRHREQGK